MFQIAVNAGQEQEFTEQIQLVFLGNNHYLFKNQDIIQYITPTTKTLHNLTQRMSSFIFFGSKQYFQGDLNQNGYPLLGFFVYENLIKPTPVFFEQDSILPKQDSRNKIVYDYSNKQLNMENIDEFNRFVKLILALKESKNFDIFGNKYNCDFDNQSNANYSDKKPTIIYTNDKIIQFKNNFAYSFSLPHLTYIKYEINTKDPNIFQLLPQIINSNQVQVHAVNGFKFFGSLQSGSPYQGKIIYDYKNIMLLNGPPELDQRYYCKIVFGNGQFYEGELLNGYYNGHGIFGNNFKGKILEGEFNNDVFIKGKIYYQKLDKCSYYDGEVKLDVESQSYLRHGFGTLHFKNGDIYQGWFNDGLYQGLGHLTFHDGSRFSGNFINGFREGEGLFTNSNQQHQFKGTYSENKRHGNGIENFASGECYEGEFQNNVREGKGVLKFAEDHEWQKYSGAFVNGKIHGEGTLTEKNSKTWKVKMYKGKLLRKEPITNY